MAKPLSSLRALLYGGLTVGILDFLYATIFVAALGRPWYRPWQSVASAVLGQASFDGGAATVALGIVLHFTVATCIVATYLLVSRAIPALRRTPFLWGPPFGVVAFFVMNLVVIPLTRIGPKPLTWTPFAIGGISLHALLLGPAAAYWSSRARQA